MDRVNKVNAKWGGTPNLAQQLRITLLPALAFSLQKCDLTIPGLELGACNTRLFFGGFEFGRKRFELGIQLARTFGVGFAVGAQGHVALSKDVELVDSLQHLDVLCV